MSVQVPHIYMVELTVLLPIVILPLVPYFVIVQPPH